MHKFPQQAAPKDAFGAQDVLYILFKHKWKILLLSLLGFTAAALVFANRKTIYQSQAKLLVRYVLNRNAVDEAQSQVNQAGGPGNQVINTEIEILTSEDLALSVAEAVGVETILPESGGKAALADAAGTILGNLIVGAMPASNVIHINYSSPDPELSVTVLRELVKQYSLRHLEIHRSANAFDIVSKQADEVRIRLKQTETELDKLRTDTGISTLAEASSAIAAQRARTQEDLMTAKAELAEQTARIRELEKSAGVDSAAALQGSDTGGKPLPPQEQAPAQVVTQYKTLLDVLALLQKRDLELKLKFKAGNRLVSLNQQQIADNEAKRAALAKRYPSLAAEAALLDTNAGGNQLDLRAEHAKLASIKARVEVYTRSLDEINDQFSKQYTIGAQIETLERRKQMEDAEYRSLELSLKNAKVDQTLDPSRMPNITLVQKPSTPIKTYDKLVQKIALGLAGGGMALGIGIAFLIELLFDRRVKRPTEIQARLQLPLLLSIPYIRRKERGGLMLSHDSGAPRLAAGDETEFLSAEDPAMPEVAIRKANHFILPYSETIRDRIIFNFEVNNIVHKPKLVAVTGLSEGAGASTIAAGLAKSFSEIKGAKVLLVDLSSYHPEDSPVFGEVARHSLNGALQLARNTKFKENAQSLYYASATARRDDSGLTTFSPMHLYELMPHLQASEFDYIVFDMPPIDQTSRTLTMAGLMDKVLLVLDAENTSRDGLKWGYSELTKGRADVSCIFNKTRTHAPNWLIGQS
jgi:polysaccharide biosynthesis transport protein